MGFADLSHARQSKQASFALAKSKGWQLCDFVRKKPSAGAAPTGSG